MTKDANDRGYGEDRLPSRRNGSGRSNEALAAAPFPGLCRVAGLIVLFLAILLWLPGSAIAAGPGIEPLRLGPSTADAGLAGHFGLLIDSSRKLDLAAVLKADADGRLEPQKDFRGAGQTRDIHWYRFDLIREPGAPADWMLEMGEAYIDLQFQIADIYGNAAAGDSPLEISVLPLYSDP
ncbi:7TM-DISM domain-containing protein, partial [Azospirillum sp. B506]|uniref:7TMR-DISMED2 domain-containing protein n=1 Tax=Azospirillum sp. B506 TaxID=137721 RepID=UPI0005B2BEDA